MKIKQFVKQLFCKHEYVPFANIHGDLAVEMNFKRTVLICKKCHKRKYIEKYIPAPYSYMQVLKACALLKEGKDVEAELFIKNMEDNIDVRSSNSPD